jgi:hypothetical protein
MDLKGYRNILVTVDMILIMISSIPALSLIVPFPSRDEAFPALWILGPKHMASDYPFNVTSGKEYMVYVGMRNNMKSAAYYVVYVKFANESEPLPNVTIGTPSPLPPLQEYIVFLHDGGSWESLIAFSFKGVEIVDNNSLVKTITVNGTAFEVNKSTEWNQQHSGFYFQLFVELWIFNVENRSFAFHRRFVSRWLNITASQLNI